MCDWLLAVGIGVNGMSLCFGRFDIGCGMFVDVDGCFGEVGEVVRTSERCNIYI
jgi:hypothetical protein